MMHSYQFEYMGGGLHWLGMMLFAIVAVWIYFLPTWIAIYRNHNYAGWIFIINLLLGYTIIGWVGSLVWAIIGDADAFERRLSMSDADELEKIHKLYKSKVITKQEYDKLKNKIINN